MEAGDVSFTLHRAGPAAEAAPQLPAGSTRVPAERWDPEHHCSKAVIRTAPAGKVYLSTHIKHSQLWWAAPVPESGLLHGEVGWGQLSPILPSRRWTSLVGCWLHASAGLSVGRAGS